jgi:hypothetical protein
MNTISKFLVVLSLCLLLAGCGDSSWIGDATSPGTPPGGGGSPLTPGPQAGALDAGGAGLPIDRVVTAAGATVSANFTTAVAVNDDGLIVGLAEVTPGTPFVAALWTVDPTGAATAAPTPLAPLVQGGFAAAFAIDGAGSVVGQAGNGPNLVAVIWPTPSTPVALPALVNGAGPSAAYAISADGSLVAGEAVDGSGVTRAVLWQGTAGSFATAPIVLPVNLFANGSKLSPFASASGVARVSATEILVVGEAEAGNGRGHAALWRSTNGGDSFAAVDLGQDFVANAVNSARRVVGESADLQAPVAWDVDAQGNASAPQTLAAAGNAVAINELSRIAGWSGASGLATAWLGTTPATLFSTSSQAYGLNNEAQPLVVGRNGNQGFVKRAD